MMNTTFLRTLFDDGDTHPPAPYNYIFSLSSPPYPSPQTRIFATDSRQFVSLPPLATTPQTILFPSIYSNFYSGAWNETSPGITSALVPITCAWICPRSAPPPVERYTCGASLPTKRLAVSPPPMMTCFPVKFKR